MSPEPRVHCLACLFVWHSEAMADGLRVIGKCPRCSGALRFHESADAPAPVVPDEPVVAVAPHRVLGLPRR
jgi:hypothetical protein